MSTPCLLEAGPDFEAYAPVETRGPWFWVLVALALIGLCIMVPLFVLPSSATGGLLSAFPGQSPPQVPPTPGAAHGIAHSATPGCAAVLPATNLGPLVKQGLPGAATVVLVWSTGCPHCQKFLPIFTDVATQVSASTDQVVFYEAELEGVKSCTAPQLLEALQFTGFPVVLIFQGGRLQQQILGYMDAPTFSGKLAAALGAEAPSTSAPVPRPATAPGGAPAGAPLAGRAQMIM